jgi:hypothetical protein
MDVGERTVGEGQFFLTLEFAAVTVQALAGFRPRILTMIRWLALCIFALGCLWCRSVLADDTAPVVDPPIRNAWKEADDASQYRDPIKASIQTEVAKLCKTTDDATAGPAITGARQWLINERRLAGSNADATTSSYLDVYSDELNKAFVAALGQADLSVNARVNIGIVCEMVTKDAQTDNMLGTALALMKDKSDAVVLWGQRAALNLMRLTLNGGNVKPEDCDQLRDAIIEAVRSHPSPPLGAIIAYEAYWGLNPENFPHANPLPVAGMKCLIQANLGVQEARLQLYKSGTPDQPEVDTHPSEFLLDSKYWPLMSKDEHLRAMQCASDLIAYAGERAATLPSNENRDLINGVKHEAIYVQELVDGQFNKNAEVDAVLGRVASLPIASRPDSIRDACRAVYPALNSLDEFSGLKRPEIGQAEAPGANLNDVKTAGVTGQGG